MVTDFDDYSLFPDEFPDSSLVGKTFAWVYLHRKEFVDFTIHEMKKVSGFYEIWQLYCKRKNVFS